MPEVVLWLVAATFLSLLGMSWLALAMETHWQQCFKDNAERRNLSPNTIILRSLGIASIATSGLCCLQADHASMAVLVWFMLLTFSAFAVAMVLSHRPGLFGIICPSVFSGHANPISTAD